MTLGLQPTPILVLALFPSFAFIDHLLCYLHCSSKWNLCEHVGRVFENQLIEFHHMEGPKNSLAIYNKASEQKVAKDAAEKDENSC